MMTGAGSLQADSGRRRMKGKGKPKFMMGKNRGQSMMAGKMEPGAAMPKAKGKAKKKAR